MRRTAAAAAEMAEAGFTLVELLVAITLLGLLTMMLFGALRFGTGAAALADAGITRSADVAAAFGFLREQLARAQPVPSAEATEQAPRIIFAGTRDSVEFAALAPGHLGTAGFLRLRIALGGGAERDRLILSAAAIPRGFAGAGAALPPHLLLARVAAADFAYFGAADEDQPPRWRDGWSDAASLPRLVRLRVTLADGRKLPDLVVAPRLAAFGTAAP